MLLSKALQGSLTLSMLDARQSRHGPWTASWHLVLGDFTEDHRSSIGTALSRHQHLSDEDAARMSSAEDEVLLHEYGIAGALRQWTSCTRSSVRVAPSTASADSRLGPLGLLL